MSQPTSTAPVLTADELLAWLETTSTSWRTLVAANPEILALPCDIMGVSTVAGLIQHIVAVELRYAEQLSGLPPTDYANIPSDTVVAMYAIHDLAMTLVREQLALPIDWSERVNYMTRSMGPARSARKTLLFHALLHGIRHYAQLATLVRKHGFKTSLPMDYILMDIERG
jgi:uncharacterized damage-inducible protein DinB